MTKLTTNTMNYYPSSDTKSLTMLLFLVVLMQIGCKPKSHSQTHVEPPTEKTETPIIIFDTDMGSDCDDVGALALLHQYALEGKAEILGCIYSSGKIRYGAGVIDAINHYYGKPDMPIGAAYDSIVGDPVDKMSAEKLAKNTGQFGHDIVRNTDTYEQVALSRKLLAGAADTSVIYVTVGHTKGLFDLLVSGSDSISSLTGRQLVEKKIKKWVALGALNAYNPDNNLKRDWNFFFNGTAPFTAHLVKNFPRPTYFVDGGSRVMTGKSLKNTPEGNIVRQAYTDWLNWYGGKTLDDQRPSWDLVTVYYAVLGLGDYFEEAPAGFLYFDANAGCVWKQEQNSYDHHFIKQKNGVDEKFAVELNSMIVPNFD